MGKAGLWVAAGNMVCVCVCRVDGGGGRRRRGGEVWAGREGWSLKVAGFGRGEREGGDWGWRASE
jgi:hypothetical protein